MAEDTRYEILSMLKTEFPGVEISLDQIYWQDPLFRQIAREYHECILKQKYEIGSGDNPYDFYADTITELKDELLEHIKKNTKLKM